MFYSHTFLARKGPLGTVWCAAHLQHKLKKSHYTSTDISSTVERIMYPEVPIALRMSGHLLLGVVRIYSKKVDYLHQDCNVVLIGIRKAFASVDINLPEDATHAPFHSITLPDTFELNALDLDDDFYQEQFHDNHHRSQEEITLADQIPVGRDPYVVITFSEDVVRDSSHVEGVSGSGATPMVEDSRPSIPVGTTAGFQDPGPSNQTGVNESPNEENIFPEIEVMRDAQDFHLEFGPLLPDQGNDIIEPDRVLEEQIMKEKEISTPAMVEELLVPGGPSIPSQQNQKLPSAASDQGPEIFDSHISFGHVSPELAIRSTPPVEQPKARPRKRKQQYDESTVLSNKFMKKALENTSDILRNRKGCPQSDLGVWKLNNRKRTDKIFLEPLMTGLCADLCNIYSKDFISTKPHLVSVEETSPEPGVAQSPAPMPDLDMEIERLRNYEGPVRSNILTEITHSPDRFMSSPPRFMPSSPRFMPSSTTNNDFTPAYGMSLGSQSDQVGTNIATGTTFGTGILPTPDLAASTGPLGSDMETPMTFLGERLGVENTGLSDIPELVNSVEGDLAFLEVDDNTPAGLQGTQEADFLLRKHNGTPEVGTLSARTRAVAQFLKKKLSVTPISEDLSGDLSLNKFLDGKRRKVCARMFYETLVLKNCGLVDVQQDELYGDITLKVTPKLSKEQFSS